MSLILVAVGSALGGVTRFLVDTWVAQTVPSSFPFGTFVVNMSGSFVLGALAALAIENDALPGDIRLPVMVGFIGAYTTFSTLMLESWRLVEGGSSLLALANLLGSMAVGLVALVLGLAVGRAVA